MSTPEEIRQIMREALEQQRAKTLATMSASAQRLVNIAPKPELETVQAKARSAFLKALSWPTAQASAAGAVLSYAFAIAALNIAGGHAPNPLTAPVSSVSGLVALLALAQFAYLIHRR
ncbi:hypothetical protein [Phaeovulum sp. NW3]|uniref:hypothetical protein n=1 Tax=Phaeovulum sp. NW3 TaxID=2934933 RepID=UPI0020218B6E|nr:hypothetical protein [Phaeovulum sp. NW3]MCL7466232.1 hypothetical protein [Phaeovulum sp. NW3]